MTLKTKGLLTTQHNTPKSSFKVFFFFFLIISHRIWNNEWSMAPSFDTSTHTVCVMDASGHLGFSLVQRLLQRGYTVHASVQSYGNLIIFQLINYLFNSLCYELWSLSLKLIFFGIVSQGKKTFSMEFHLIPISLGFFDLTHLITIA